MRKLPDMENHSVTFILWHYASIFQRRQIGRLELYGQNQHPFGEICANFI